MMKRKMATSVLVLIVAVSITIGGVAAFFSDMDRTPTNRFTGGIVNIKADETLIPGPTEIDDWTPGEPVEEIYEIKNTGTVPIFLRASYIGSWSPLTTVSGQHKNTATVTGNFEGQIVTDEDSAHYHVVTNTP